MSARHFSDKIPGEEDKQGKRWKMVGGAVAGAAGLNLAENRYRVYTEEMEEKGKDYVDLGQPMELMGEIGNAIP